MMASRITVQSLIPDARAKGYKGMLQERFPKGGLRDIAVTTSYTINAPLKKKELEQVGRELANTVTECFSHTEVLSPKKFSVCIEIGFLPGVTDNVGKTVLQMVEDALGKRVSKGVGVYSSLYIFLSGNISKETATIMSRELYNPLIERATLYSLKEFTSKKIPLTVPEVALHSTTTSEIPLEVSDDELVRIGKEGIANPDGTRRGPLALSLSEMHAIRDYFRTQKRNPNDIELEAVAQTWSEHCKHTIFNDPLDDISEGLFRRYIRSATETVRRQKGKKDFCVSVFTDNSGAIAFDEKYAVTHKVETHNSPSALDPFGGAITGIVGVNRDTLGFGLGASPIANIYGFCVGNPDDNTVLYRDQAKTQALLPSRRILEGVVRGINSGGNQSGIPTPLGFVYAHDRFRGKPLVFAGTIGLIPRKVKGRSLSTKKARPGDYVVVIGGRVGLDGIHGATFSSEALGSKSPATAVQIGDPITQKKLSDALIHEARDKGLYSSITDNGAGGISCSVAEMARECGGCIVNLEAVPLKYAGLAPWQIWISESQERMTLSVPPQKWKTLEKLLKTYDVESARIGTFTKSGKCVVKYGKKTIMNVSMDFLTNGRPIEQQQSKKPEPVLKKVPPKKTKPINIQQDTIALLKRPNIGSFRFISEQYDHEVQGNSITKPLQGRGRVNASAAVLRPVRSSNKGIVISHGYYPLYSELDPYMMAGASLDTAVRNAICAGGSLDTMAILDNFCWSSGNSPERLYQLKEAARACYDGAVTFGAPFISGKDSMFNDFNGYTEDGSAIHIAALPTLLVSAIGVMKNVRTALTMDLKSPGNVLYILGETREELAGSEYELYRQEKKSELQPSIVPKVNFAENKRTYAAFAQANQKKLIASALGISHGGFIAALSNMAIAGQLGVQVELQLPGSASTPEALLFSESQGRILLEVPKQASKQFEQMMKQKNVACKRIGTVTNTPMVTIQGKVPASFTLKQLTTAYRSAFRTL